jgi:hypothetical protein
MLLSSDDINDPNSTGWVKITDPHRPILLTDGLLVKLIDCPELTLTQASAR